MKKSRFTEPQIIKILNEQDQGKSVSDICRVHGVVEGTRIGIKFIEVGI